MVSTSENPLVKPEVYETKRIQLTSPILHIGSEVSKLSPFEYVQTESRVYLPNQEALAKALHHRGKLQEYIRRIENREEITSLLKEAFGDNWQNNQELEAIFPKTGISRKWTEEKITDLRPMIRNGFGQLYIPGSSIKGAIRTAIAYYLLKHEEQYQVPEKSRVSEIENRLRARTGQLKDNAKKANDDLMKSLFSEFELFYQGRCSSGKIESSNTDFMRAIKVTDSKPIIKRILKSKDSRTKDKNVNIPVVAKVIVSSFVNTRTKEGFLDKLAKYKAPIYAEMAYEVWTEFTLILDTEMLSWFRRNDNMSIPFTTIEDILKICKEFAQDQWEYEQKYWKSIKNNPSEDLYFDSISEEFYAQSKCPYGLRIGWGSGMMGTTIDLQLNEQLRSEIRDACGLDAPNYEAPKSRRAVVNENGEIKFAPGWVKFKVL
ncbi:type III-A CRISPR-associated RAMP protein Csm5 [Oscillatoriales cyanobacterium USR001]|nr:type III-A CRISPR-associated RAMP protein Csm5 [Oscillatoriales cyanobacterium USR001]